MLRILTGQLRFLNSNKILTNLYFSTSQKKYILSQFPYPSGQLHLGHARVYYIGDTLARYYKLQKQNVIYPIGFDSFGLPAQNAAIVHGKNPKTWTQNNIYQMKQQLNSLNIDFDWNLEIATHIPQYYKWTQRIFLQMFKKGLAYKAQSEVNWDPVDKTVLANEQVDNLGRSWRSGALIEKKMLSQWFLKITNYAQVLQNSLSSLGWIDRVKAMQAGWIGFQKGFQLQLEIKQLKQQIIKQIGDSELMNLSRSKKLPIFVKSPSILNSQFYIRYNIESNAGDKNQRVEQYIGTVLHPINKKQIAIKLGKQQNGIKFQAVPINEQSNKSSQSLSFEQSQFSLKQVTVMRIRDWSISRQRYWGCPIPIIYCKSCGIVPVPDSQLPVILPQWKGEGNPLLNSEFKFCVCPKCKKQNAQRQTDTMDTFVDSSWYYLRFLDPKNQSQLCKPDFANYWMPVDIYIGGIEHAIMHLLYARFIMRVLVDLQVCKVEEPFKELIVQGLVKGKATKHKVTGKYLKADQVKNYKLQEIEETYEKMSKSKFNGLNPQHLVSKYGSDALRMALFFASPPQHDIDFHEDLLVSAERFLKKVQALYQNLHSNSDLQKIDKKCSVQDRILSFSRSCPKQAFDIKKIIEKLEHSIQKRYMHVYIANVMELFNQIKQIATNEKHKQFILILLEDVFMPILGLGAPATLSKLMKSVVIEQSRKLEWPKVQYFISFKQYLLMKGNKLVRKGLIQSKQTGQEYTEQQIVQKLQLPKDSNVKFTKKGIVIIIK